MKLSEAIKLGAMNGPQAFDAYTDGVGTCALGAALKAVGCAPVDAGTIEAGEHRHWPWIAERVNL